MALNMTRRQQILSMIQKKAKQVDIARELGMSKQLVRGYLLLMIKDGLINRNYPFVLTKQGKIEASSNDESDLTSKD
jgi:predicted transcriptional regulator